MPWQTHTESHLITSRQKSIWKKLWRLIPNRQDILFVLAQNKIGLGKFDEIKKISDELLANTPDSGRGKFYHSVSLSPYEWGDGVDYVEELSISLRGRCTTEGSQLAFIRNSYKAYLNYFLREKDSIGMITVFTKAVAIENMLGEVWEIRSADRTTTLTANPSQAEYISSGLNAFKIYQLGCRCWSRSAELIFNVVLIVSLRHYFLKIVQGAFAAHWPLFLF